MLECRRRGARAEALVEQIDSRGQRQREGTRMNVDQSQAASAAPGVAAELPAKASVLGSQIHMVQMPDVLEIMRGWIERERERCHFVVNTGMHGVIEGHKDPQLKAILNSSDLFTPDGFSVIAIGRLRGYPLKKRVNAADLMDALFRTSEERGWSHYFYGDTDETLGLLREALNRDYPRVRIAGTYSPPFRPLTPEEDTEIVDMINEARPDILWVGLGLPKQERWIHEHRDRLRLPVAIGIGAGFRFMSGQTKRAPRWIGEHGFEWLWRLVQQPKRCWRRCFVDGPHFLWHVGLELMRFEGYE